MCLFYADRTRVVQLLTKLSYFATQLCQAVLLSNEVSRCAMMNINQVNK